MRELADSQRVAELVDDLTRRVAGVMTSPQGAKRDWALVGVRSRGDLLATRIAQRLANHGARLGDHGENGDSQRLGTVDITLYRDDLSEMGNQARVQTTEVPFDIDGLDVVLVDDVAMTGRTARAALDCLTDLGRPRRVWLAVLVDRGCRELPIVPDIVALDIADVTEPDERVRVELTPLAERDSIIVGVPGEKALQPPGGAST